MTKDNGLILATFPPENGNGYGSFNVYVRTGDPTGQYYVRYMFQYEYNDARDVYTPNSTTNISNYRIKTAQLVRIVGIAQSAVEDEILAEVLQQGEISLAIKQKPDIAKITPEALQAITFEDGVNPDKCDFIGGYHGDERLVTATLTADGKQIDIGQSAKNAVMPCSELVFDQTATLYKWGTSTENSFGTPAADHSQHWVITEGKVTNRQMVTWKTGDFRMNTASTYLQMFTMKRKSGGNTVCETFRTYDGAGNCTGEKTVGDIVAVETYYLNHQENRSVRYESKTSGISAVAGFVPVQGVQVTRAFVAARTDDCQADDKWYVSFMSDKNGDTPVSGEQWIVDEYFKIDYIAPVALQRISR